MDWFAQIASADTEQSKAIIRLAAEYANSLKTSEWTADRNSYVYGRDYIRPTLKIIPDRDGELCCPDDIWLARPDQSAPNQHFVADELVNDSEIQPILLKTLEVRDLLEGNLLELLEQSIKEHIERESTGRSARRDWSGLWQILRSARPEDREAFATTYKGQVRIRRQDGTWQHPYAVLLPGEIVPTTDPDERKPQDAGRSRLPSR